jgi:hypothetical protein
MPAMVVTPSFANRDGDIMDMPRRRAITLMPNGTRRVIEHAWRLAVIAAISIVAPIVERRSHQRTDRNARHDGNNERLPLDGRRTARPCKASRQQYNLGNPTDHECLLVSRGGIPLYQSDNHLA